MPFAKKLLRQPYGAARRLTKGLLACAMVSLAAAFLAENYQTPIMLFALLLGMSLNFLHADEECAPGIDFCASTLLRTGVALLGTRILLTDVVEIGATTALVVVTGIGLTIGVGVATARALRLDAQLGMLSGGAVAICGISAAMTLSSTMPGGAQNARNTLLTVILIASVGAAAMVTYPLIAEWAGLGELATGVFLGGSIHDVSHVVGASYGFPDAVTDYAMIVKMLRVACLLPVAWLFIVYFRARTEDGDGAGSPRLPWFLLVFVAIAAINNFGLIPAAAAQAADEISRACFVAAIAALGIKTALKDLLAVGWRPILLIFLESSFLGMLVFGWASYLS